MDVALAWLVVISIAAVFLWGWLAIFLGVGNFLNRLFRPQPPQLEIPPWVMSRMTHEQAQLPDMGLGDPCPVCAEKTWIVGNATEDGAPACLCPACGVFGVCYPEFTEWYLPDGGIVLGNGSRAV